jgi:hypothetical protein
VVTRHPYRDPPEPPRARKRAGTPSEEWFLIALLVVIGGVRIAVAVASGRPLDAEPTIALAMLVLGVWCGMRGFRR